MERLLNSKVECTDPDTLQFRQKISATKFWYCEPNIYHNDLLPEANTHVCKLYHKYLGNPNELLQDTKTDERARSFVCNEQLWMSGEIDVADFPQEEKLKLLDDYGYAWDSFRTDAERNQIICENHFESYPMDYRHDI